jgi:lipid A 3-O-deacylase
MKQLTRRSRNAVRTMALCLSATVPAGPASAGEVFGGAFVHDVATPLNKAGQEHGIDIHAGWRGERIAALALIGRPSPHLYAAINTAGDTNFAVAGLGWKLGSRVYIRPGIGLAIHDGPNYADGTPQRIWFGSRILFAPEVSIGTRLSERMSLEASWVHFSHAQIFGHQNPGTDSFGVRLNYRY